MLYSVKEAYPYLIRTDLHQDSLMDLQVIPAVKEISHLPIISDPSHATFWAPWVESMTLASIAAGCDGLLIEIHPDPKNAAVDPLQPLSFSQFKSLIKKSRI